MNEITPTSPLSQSESYITTRSVLFGHVEQILEILAQLRNSKKIESDDLFVTHDSTPKTVVLDFKGQVTRKTKLQVLVEEKESLGLYVSGDPLEEYSDLVEYVREVAYSDDIHLILINKIKKIFTKSNQMMFALNASTGGIEVDAIIFPKRALDLSPIIQEKELFWVKGKLSNTATKSTTQKVTDEGDVQEYDELPKLPVNELVPFRSGVIALFTSTEQPLSEGSIRRLSDLDWNTLYTNPHSLRLIGSEKKQKRENIPTPQQSLPSEPKNTVPADIYLPASLGVAKLKEIKATLSKEQKPNLTEVNIFIEQDGEYKKAKGTFWGPEELVARYSKK